MPGDKDEVGHHQALGKAKEDEEEDKKGKGRAESGASRRRGTRKEDNDRGK